MRELIPPEAYSQVFTDGGVGEKILEELTAVFYDIDAFDPENSHRTAYMAGQRSVMKFIIAKVMNGHAGTQQEKEE